MANRYINLLQSHEPLMDAGDYEVTVKQTLKVTSKGISGNFVETKRKFSVFGERFFLEPGSVHSVYPPAGSLGEHSATFPHVILSRSTLPWERSVDGGRDGIWLALLLFDEKETPKPQTILLGDYKRTMGFKNVEQATGLSDNGPFHELGDGPDNQPISVIDVPSDMLLQLMPKRADLDFSAHSRRESLSNDPKKPQVIGPELAVIIGNRLPKAGGLSTVHLVSLENRFKDKGEFDFSKKTPEGNIRLLSLKSWSFTSVNPKYNLFGMLEHLNRSPSQLCQPFLNDQVLNLQRFWDASKYGFTVTNSNNAVTESTPGTFFFNESGHLSVEVLDSAIDADKNPQLDPFPEAREFTIAMTVKVTQPSEANRYPICGASVSTAQGKRYKPSLWHVPSTHGLEYRVSSESGEEFFGEIPAVFSSQGFHSLSWVKDGNEFRFYVDGRLVGKQPAPARMFTDDSLYFIGATSAHEHPKFFGHLKQFHVFRRALPQNEIHSLFDENVRNIERDVNEYFSQGMVALPHRFRMGKKGVSWYRGPLSVRTENAIFSLPAVATDQLLVFDQRSGMFDASYATAWQLGRLMALEDQQFSLELYRWKRRQSMESKRIRQLVRAHLKLGNENHTEGISEVKDKIIKWMRSNYYLEKVPFQYLVPHADMLPPESIRFFDVDYTWVRCLNDGVASIGRTSSDDIDPKKSLDLAGVAETMQNQTVPRLTGFLLRSELVSGYPGLQILGYSQILGNSDNPDEETALKIARREKLSDEVLLCLFEGNVQTVDFFQRPDVLHFGLDSDGDGNYSKQLRKANGANLSVDHTAFELGDKHFHNKDLRVVDFKHMAGDIRNMLLDSNEVPANDKTEFSQFTSADFAMEMLEGAERVRFKHFQPVGTA